MVEDAQSHADEDKRRREEIGVQKPRRQPSSTPPRRRSQDNRDKLPAAPTWRRRRRPSRPRERPWPRARPRAHRAGVAGAAPRRRIVWPRCSTSRPPRPEAAAGAPPPPEDDQAGGDVSTPRWWTRRSQVAMDLYEASQCPRERLRTPRSAAPTSEARAPVPSGPEPGRPRGRRAFPAIVPWPSRCWPTRSGGPPTTGRAPAPGGRARARRGLRGLRFLGLDARETVWFPARSSTAVLRRPKAASPRAAHARRGPRAGDAAQLRGILGRGHAARAPRPQRDLCPTCAGSGDVAFGPVTCPRCGGSGQMRAQPRSHDLLRGAAPIAAAAARRRGALPALRGERPRDPERVARGRRSRPGRSNGARVRVPGGGNAGRAAAPRATSSWSWSWRPIPSTGGRATTCTAPCLSRSSRPRWAGTSRCRRPDGRVSIEIPAGTQNGQRFRLRKRGVPQLGEGGRGDLYVEVEGRGSRASTDDRSRAPAAGAAPASTPTTHARTWTRPRRSRLAGADDGARASCRRRQPRPRTRPPPGSGQALHDQRRGEELRHPSPDPTPLRARRPAQALAHGGQHPALLRGGPAPARGDPQPHSGSRRQPGRRRDRAEHAQEDGADAGRDERVRGLRQERAAFEPTRRDGRRGSSRPW